MRIPKRGVALGGALLSLTLLVAACGGSPAPTGGGKPAPVHLTLWQNYGSEANATATADLIKAFEKLHPNITITDVSQPASNYFSLLQAAAISHTGPDLAVMWTGLFTLQYRSYLENLKSWVPASDLARMEGLRWTAQGFNAASGPYVIPLEDQFYIGFYNKALFRKAGITQLPTTWAQLLSDCQTFKAARTTCLYYGSGSQSLGAEFYPWYDMSYMMIGALSLPQWQQLYSGQIPWTSPIVTAQLARWHSLYADGYTNRNVVTAINSLTAFEQGKAAMMIKGNWDLALLSKAMGSNLGVFVPPFSNTPMHGVVQYPGDGFAMTNYSTHKAAAAEFLQFLTTPAAGNIVTATGLISDVRGVTTSDPISQQMLAFAAQQGMTKYPMLDNVVQSNVVNAGSTVLPAFLAGQLSAAAAARKLQQAWQSLPAGQRGPDWQSYK
ncbi:MAG TPA: ABC transporter substrate-binding protein [Candidatus Dormibacteraeota bacterium]|nr:ABC transporter substrate-binding protein [Candidatus Dormibacteraeota bacterium]